MNTIHVNWPLMVAALLPWAALTAAALFTPYWTRPDLFFSVTVKPSFRQSTDGRDILRRYERSVAMVALLALFLTVLPQLGHPLLLLSPVLFVLAGWFAAFLAARRRAMPYHAEPSPAREAALQCRDIPMPGGVIAWSGSLLILAIVALCLWLGWDRIPTRVATHWGLTGKADDWADKKPARVFACVAFGFLFCALMTSFWYAILHGVRRIHGSGAAAIRELRFVRLFSFFTLGTEYWVALLMGFLGLAALRSHPDAPLPAFLPFILGQTILLSSVFILCYRTGQGGWRLQEPADLQLTDDWPVGDRTPDECWKLGLFYYNPNDPALFVEKRFGVGWTFNMANPRVWFIVGGILLIPAAWIAIRLLIAK